MASTKIIAGTSTIDTKFIGGDDGITEFWVGGPTQTVGLSVNASGDVSIPKALNANNNSITANSIGYTDSAKQRVIMNYPGMPLPVGQGSVTFMNIPAWATKIKVVIYNLTLLDTTSVGLRLGTAGGIEDTGYRQSSIICNGTTRSTISVASTFSPATPGAVAAGATGFTMTYNLTKVSDTTWQNESFVAWNTNVNCATVSTGSKTLNSTLDRLAFVALTTNTFVTGSYSVLIEGLI